MRKLAKMCLSDQKSLLKIAKSLNRCYAIYEKELEAQ